MFNKVYIVKKPNSNNDADVSLVVFKIKQGINFANNPASTKFTVPRKLIDNVGEIDSQTLIIAVGGDGTMLQAMKLAAENNATAYGINLGNLGFLTEMTFYRDHADYLSSQVSSLLEAHPLQFKIEHRQVISMKDENHIAINEFSIFRDEPDTMVYYNIKIDGMNAGFHRANSLLLSTSTGSTAYSLSAGGALLMPGLDVFQIVPVAPFTLTSRPILVSASSIIELSAWGGNIQVRADGIIIDEKKKATKDNPYTTSFVGEKNCKILVHHENQFFRRLTQKLGWIDHWERIK